MCSARFSRLKLANNFLAGINVVVTHIKPVVNGDDVATKIKTELGLNNSNAVNFFFPTQGIPFHVTTSDGIQSDAEIPQTGVQPASIDIILAITTITAMICVVACVVFFSKRRIAKAREEDPPLVSNRV